MPMARCSEELPSISDIIYNHKPQVAAARTAQPTFLPKSSLQQGTLHTRDGLLKDICRLPKMLLMPTLESMVVPRDLPPVLFFT